jgi:hypothetical protein
MSYLISYNWAVLLHCPPPSPFFDGGRQGRLNVVPMTNWHGGALARL